MAFGGACNSETLQPIFRKLGISDCIATPPHMPNLVTIGSKWAWLCMREIRFYTSFFSCAQLQISPLDRPMPLMAQTKRPEGYYMPYMFSIKILIIYFLPQFLKICIMVYGDFKAV